MHQDYKLRQDNDTIVATIASVIRVQRNIIMI